MFYNFFFFIYFSLFSVSSCSPFVPFCFYLFLIFLCFRFLSFFPCSLLSFFVSVNFVFNHLVWLLGYFALVVLLLSDFSVFVSSLCMCAPVICSALVLLYVLGSVSSFLFSCCCCYYLFISSPSVLSFLWQYPRYFFLFLLPHCMTCKVLAPQPGVEPEPLGWKC